MKSMIDRWRRRLDRPAHAARPPLLAPWLGAALTLTLVATAAVTLWPSTPVVGANVPDGKVAADRRSRQLPRGVATTHPMAAMRGPGLAALLEPAEPAASAPFDPFAGVVPPPPPPPPPVVQAPPPPPPKPPAPVMNYRYMGTLTNADGSTQLFLTRGDAAIAVRVGDVLDDGYVVESIASAGVVLTYPAAGVRVTIPTPKTGGLD
jgi:hypothetical protein